MPAAVGEETVGRSVTVYWAEEDDWFDGVIDDYVDHPDRGYHIQYYDGDEEWLPSLQPTADRKLRFADSSEEPAADVSADSGADVVHSSSNPNDSDVMNHDLVPADDAFMDTLDRGGEGKESALEDDQLSDLMKRTVRFGETDELRIIDDSNNRLGGVDFDTHGQRELLAEEMREQLELLPPRGVLLAGSVLGVEGAPDELLHSDVIFKILFVEGGDQPAMFRCKTPIYTSDPAVCNHDSGVLLWHRDDCRFRFDMVMPDDVTTEKQRNSHSMQEYGFNIQGEIILSLYQASKGGGGNTMLGQLTFNLVDLVSSGTIEPFLAGYEGRSLSGSQQMKLRNAPAGVTNSTVEVELQLCIGWKALFDMRGGALDAADLNFTDATALPQRSQSAGPARKKSEATTSAAASVAGASQRKSLAAASKKSKTATPAPRKIVSKFQLQQAADKKRLKAENKRVQQKLQAAGPAKSIRGKSSSAAADSEPLRKAKASETTLPTAAVAAADDAQVLQQIVLDMRSKNAGIADENKKLRGKLNMLKTSVQHCEQSIEKLDSRRSVCGSCDRPSNSFLKSTDSKSAMLYRTLAGSKQSNRPTTSTAAGTGGEMHSEFMRHLGHSHNSSSSSSRNRAPHVHSPAPPKSARAAAADDAKAGFDDAASASMRSTIRPLTEAEMKEYHIDVDSEYRNLAEEFTVLQSVRRGLLDRIAAAKEARSKVSSDQASMRSRTALLQRRLAYYEDVAGEAVWFSSEPTVAAAVSGNGASAAAGLSKSASRYANTRTAAAGAATNEDDDGDDEAIFNQLRQAKLNLAREEALQSAGMHTIAQESALAEQRALLSFLSDSCAQIDQETLQLQEAQRAEQRRLASLVRSNLVFRARSSITQMRAEALKQQQRARVAPIKSGQQTVELELLRLRLRRKEIDIAAASAVQAK